MSLISYKRGQTSVILRVKLLDSSVTTGAGKTGLTNSSAGLIIGTIADNEAATTAYTQAGATIQTITTLGTYAAPSASNCRFKEVDATNHPGIYEIQLADARFAVASAKSLVVSVSGVTNLAQCDMIISLTDMDPYDAVRGGMTALPNANASASGGLPTIGTGSGQVSLASGQVVIQAGTGAGQLDFTSGVVKANKVQLLGGTIPAPNVTGVELVDLKYILGTVSPAQAGSVAADWSATTNKTATANLSGTTINLANTVTTYTGNTPQTGDNFVRLGAPSGASIAADLAEIEAETDGIAAIPTNPYTGTPPTVAQIATAVWQDLLASSDFSTASSIGKLLKDDVNAPIGSIPTTTPLTAAQIATGVWQDATASDFTTASSIGKLLYTTGVNVASWAGQPAVLDSANYPIVSVGAFYDIPGGIRKFVGSSGGAGTVTFQSGVLPKQGDQMDLVNAPNATAVTAIQSGLATATNLATANTNISTLLTRIPASLFTGITRMAYWLMALMRKEADATTVAEINAANAATMTGAYDPTLDSLDAIRERGDAAWGGAVTVAPTAAATVPNGVVAGPSLTVYQNATPPSFLIPILNADGSQYNLTGKTVKFIVFDIDGVPYFQLTCPSSTTNIATVGPAAAQLINPGIFKYEIWDVTSSPGTIIGEGPFTVSRTVQPT